MFLPQQRPLPATATALEAQGDRLRVNGETLAAQRCYLLSVEAAGTDRDLVEPAIALERGDLPLAERRLRAVLWARPTCLAAMRLMAMLALRLGRREDGVALLSRALDLAPAFAAAREMRARTLQHMNRFEPALADVEILRRDDAHNPSLAMLHAALLVRLGRQADAAALYDQTLAHHPDSITGWLSYGHVLKAVGRVTEAVEAYRKAIAGRGDFGEAWWSLANLKTVRFTPGDVAAMERALDGADAEDRFHLHFALGKAHEDRGGHEAAFTHYRDGNQLRRAGLTYDPQTITAHVDASAGALAAGLPMVEGEMAEGEMAEGEMGRGAIFVVGLPRSGSTLVEQILSSHPAIEGTSELPGMMMIGERLGQRMPGAQERHDLGAEYMAHAAQHRHENKPFFIDKMPNNWQHAALIRQILPGARIVDVRRHPMAVGWSAYKQHFARGQEFSYDLGDLGRYYRDYVRMMAAFDSACPGHVHRVVYERLVADTETQVRALLAAIDLPFDEACLRFWANDRVVRTPSSQQVRQPVFTKALNHWTNYAQWMEPLRQQIGDLEQNYDKR